MPVLRLLPDNTVFRLEPGALLTELEFDYFGERRVGLERVLCIAAHVFATGQSSRDSRNELALLFV